jgi:hypothetical protein
MSFTQPICERCFRILYLGREPVRLKTPEVETCCTCGEETSAGIYARIDVSVPLADHVVGAASQLARSVFAQAIEDGVPRQQAAQLAADSGARFVAKAVAELGLG